MDSCTIFGIMLTLLLFGMQVAMSSPNTRNATTSEELTSILSSVKAGDTIQLLAQEYSGEFFLNAIGTKDEPIVLQGDLNDTTTIVGKDIGITLTGDYWHVKGLSVKADKTAVNVTGKNNILEAFFIQNVETAINITGPDNTIDKCSMENVDNGIIISGNNTILNLNNVNAKKIGLDIDETACCAKLTLNNFGKGIINMKGTGHHVAVGNCMRCVPEPMTPDEIKALADKVKTEKEKEKEKESEKEKQKSNETESKP